MKKSALSYRGAILFEDETFFKSIFGNNLSCFFDKNLLVEVSDGVGYPKTWENNPNLIKSTQKHIPKPDLKPKIQKIHTYSSKT